MCETECFPALIFNINSYTTSKGKDREQERERKREGDGGMEADLLALLLLREEADYLKTD